MVQKPEGPNTYDSKNPAIAIWQPYLQDVVVGVQLGRADVDVRVLALQEVLGQAPHLLRPRCGPHEHLRTEVIEVIAFRSEVYVEPTAPRRRFSY